jgi:DNA polymerase I-like protein with 3'-5' exonuclease and polymerase domains
MRLSFDIETDGLLDTVSVIHSLVMVDMDTGNGWSCVPSGEEYTSPNGFEVLSIEDGLKLLAKADEAEGHNVIGYDMKVIKKLYPELDFSRVKINDTMIEARLIWPEVRENDFQRRKRNIRHARAMTKQALHAFPALSHDVTYKHFQNKLFPPHLIGSHSLEAWGYRLGEWKGDYSADMKAQGKDPWAEWNPSMQEYCEQDVIVTLKLRKLIDREGCSPMAVEIERRFAEIITEMEDNGFPFDIEGAKKLQEKLIRRRAVIYAQLQEAFPPITDRWTFTPKVNNKTYGYVKGVPIEKTKEIVFNPGSREHIARWLKQKYGWKPNEYTEGGKPQINEVILKALDYPEAKLLAEYFLLDKRLSMLEGRGGKGLIPHAKKGAGVIHGRVDTTGAVTRRCTHSSPNMAQIPAVNVPFGREFRELLYAPEGYVLLGWDASGLELRCFAHYMAHYDGGEYRDTVLSGDIHWTHAVALGLVPDGTEYDEHDDHHNHSRNKVAKRFIYAYLYGAGAVLIGSIMLPKGTRRQQYQAGRKLIKTFLAKTPALRKLKNALKRRINTRKMYIKAIDGGLIKVRSEHAALNTLLQSAGAIAVKLATIIYYDKLVDQGLVSGDDFLIVAHVHDEVQTLVKKGLEEVVGQAAIEAIREAGETLGFNCPLDGEWKAGANWAETH